MRKFLVVFALVATVLTPPSFGVAPVQAADAPVVIEGPSTMNPYERLREERRDDFWLILSSRVAPLGLLAVLIALGLRNKKLRHNRRAQIAAIATLVFVAVLLVFFVAQAFIQADFFRPIEAVS